MLSSPSTDRHPRKTNRRIPWVIAAATIAVLVVAAPRALPPEAPTGDHGLATRITEGPGAPSGDFAAAVIHDGTVDFAGRGADEHTAFEVGSISKVFGGMLLADAIDREEVTANTTLGEVFGYPTDGSGAITLQQLATHTSGLPRMPRSVPFFVGGFLAQFANTNSSAQSVDEVIKLGRNSHPDEDPGFAYSNFGAALLGQALAQVAGTSYPQLVKERITGPLGMDRTWVQPVDAGTSSATQGSAPRLPTPMATGHLASGHVAAAWPMDGFAPAGGIHSTAGDLVLLAQAVLDGTVPGRTSLDPVADNATDGKVGLAWMITSGTGQSSDDNEVIWHNGMTGGFATYLGLQPDADRAVVVLSGTALGVDEAGLDLLNGGSQ